MTMPEFFIMSWAFSIICAYSCLSQVAWAAAVPVTCLHLFALTFACQVPWRCLSDAVNNLQQAADFDMTCSK